MTTVTLDTLSNTGTIFVRDCLRNNITDRQSPARAGTAWIFKGQPARLDIDYPFVVCEESFDDAENLTLNGETSINNDFRVHIEVWADKMDDRDVLADEIVKICRDVNSDDSGSDSFSDQGLIFKSSEKSDNDAYKTDTELVRIKFVDITFQYVGS